MIPSRIQLFLPETPYFRPLRPTLDVCAPFHGVSLQILLRVASRERGINRLVLKERDAVI